MSRTPEREVQAYLAPKYYNLFLAYKEANEMGKSEAMNVIVRDFFDRMQDYERQKLIARRQSKNSY